MKKEQVAVLFMDDEIHDVSATVVQEAVNALRQEGFAVDVMEKMSPAVDAFYNKFYKVFVLDIDMQKIADEFFSGKRGGTNIASIYRSLDNGASVIMYSGAGIVEDWFDVTNRHVYGYVFKNSSGSPVQELVDMVKKAAVEEQPILIPSPRQSGDVLVAGYADSGYSRERLDAIVSAAGNFKAVFCQPEEISEKLAQCDFSAVLAVADFFSTDPEDGDMDVLYNICRMQPYPHAIFGCCGKDEYQASILSIINMRPFRLVNLLKEDAADKLSAAIRDAAKWYGGNETFQADSTYVHRAAENIDWEELKQKFTEDADWEDETDE